MKNIDVVSYNIRGEEELLVADHQSTRTSFRKIPVTAGSLKLEHTGFEGDSVVHTEHHGGNDKAICCYSAEHFDYWEQRLGIRMEPSAFGENLTLAGKTSLEKNVYIGDRYQLGEAIVEVSEPRGPCYIIGIRYNYKLFPVHLQETGFTGFYLRTIKPGNVKTTDGLVHLSTHPEKISVMDINHIRYHDPQNKEWLERIVNLEPLTREWRERLGRVLRNA